MRFLIQLCFFLLSISFSSFCAFSQDFSSTIAFIQSEANRTGIPGLSYAITQGNQVLVSAGIGVRSLNTNVPVDANTLFHIGSTNKSITAFMLARMAESGLLSWRATIEQMAPSLTISDSAIRRIQLQQLLNMTSGLLDFSEDDLFDVYSEDTATAEQLFQFIQSYRAPQFPGKEFSYSNLSASLAGYLAVYRSAGSYSSLNDGYSKLLHEWVLEPLGMQRSTIYLSEARTDSNHSVSHEKRAGSSSVADSYDRDDDVFAPAGSIKSSANEMARYLMTLAQKGLNAEGLRVIKKRSLRKLFRPSAVLLSSGDDYGLGWDKTSMSGLVMMKHEGAYDNFTSVIAVNLKHRASLVILVNTEATGNLLTQAVAKFAADLAGQ